MELRLTQWNKCINYQWFNLLKAKIDYTWLKSHLRIYEIIRKSTGPIRYDMIPYDTIYLTCSQSQKSWEWRYCQASRSIFSLVWPWPLTFSCFDIMNFCCNICLPHLVWNYRSRPCKPIGYGLIHWTVLEISHWKGFCVQFRPNHHRFIVYYARRQQNMLWPWCKPPVTQSWSLPCGPHVPTGMKTGLLGFKISHSQVW